MTGRRRLALLLSGAAAATLLLLVFPGRDIAAGLWLRAGDLLSPSFHRKAAAGHHVLFDGSILADREGLVRRHGELTVSTALAGKAAALAARSPGGRHEVCTRRLPRDWSRYRVLRLELAGARGGRCDRSSHSKVMPLRLSLRLRSAPGWRGARWFHHQVFLAPNAGAFQLALAPVGEVVDLSNVRQLCLALGSRARQGRPALILRRMVIDEAWTLPRGRKGAPRLSLALVGDSTRLRRFDPVPPATHLNGPGDTAHLHAARNEVVAFQIVLTRGARGPDQASVTLGDLVGPDARAISPRLFEERTIVVREVSSAMFGPGSPGPGVYADPLTPLDKTLALRRGNRLVWVDVTVPEDAPPGTYRATLRVRAGGQDLTRKIRVQVHPARLPHAGRQLVMIYYSPHMLKRSLALTHEGLITLEREVHRLVHAHGAYLVTDPSLASMKRFVPMLSGALYTAGPGRGQGAPYWPVDLMARGKQATQRAAVETMKWFGRHGPRTRPFVYLADEPGTREDYDKIRRQASWIHDAPKPGNSLPVMVTEQVAPDDATWPSLVGAVDIWVSPRNFPEPAGRRRQDTTERFFTYNGGQPGSGSHLLDADGVSLRTWGWIAFIHRIDLWFLWQGTYFIDQHNRGGITKVYTDPVTFDQRRTGGDDFGNGDGVIVYPPPVPGGSPAPSTRLKVLRRGVQDRLYLLQVEACGKGKQARQIARRLIPRSFGEAAGCTASWPRDEKPWEDARRELLDILDQCQRAGK